MLKLFELKRQSIGVFSDTRTSRAKNSYFDEFLEILQLEIPHQIFVLFCTNAYSLGNGLKVEPN